MILYLSGILEGDFYKKHEKDINLGGMNVLQSFAYAKDKYAERYHECKRFLMDSGAFTIMNSKKTKNFDIKKFATEYANFVKKYNVDNFIELDIDGVFGLQTYIDVLHMVQDITGKDPIRVFHQWRGKDYFEELVKQKNYVCLGSGVLSTGRRDTTDYLDWFIDKAHENNCMIHGLAMTGSSVIRKRNFDSADSSTWTYSIRGGCVYNFDGHGIVSHQSGDYAPKGHRINSEFCMNNAVNEWVKYSQYLDEEYI